MNNLKIELLLIGSCITENLNLKDRNCHWYHLISYKLINLSKI